LVGQVCINWLSKNDEKVQQKTRARRSFGGECFIITEVLTIVVGISVSAATSSSLGHLDADAWTKLTLLGILTWGIPNFLALLAERTNELVTLGLFWLCDPIFVPTWPVLFGQDPIPSPLSWFGALLILTALIVQRTKTVSKEKRHGSL